MAVDSSNCSLTLSLGRGERVQESDKTVDAHRRGQDARPPARRGFVAVDTKYGNTPPEQSSFHLWHCHVARGLGLGSIFVHASEGGVGVRNAVSLSNSVTTCVLVVWTCPNCGGERVGPLCRFYFIYCGTLRCFRRRVYGGGESVGRVVMISRRSSERVMRQCSEMPKPVFFVDAGLSFGDDGV